MDATPKHRMKSHSCKWMPHLNIEWKGNLLVVKITHIFKIFCVFYVESQQDQSWPWNSVLQRGTNGLKGQKITFYYFCNSCLFPCIPLVQVCSCDIFGNSAWGEQVHNIWIWACNQICHLSLWPVISKNAVATEPVPERNLTALESRHRITCGHNRVTIVFRREPVVRVAGIAMKQPGMCKLSKVNVMQCDNAETFW